MSTLRSRKLTFDIIIAILCLCFLTVVLYGLKSAVTSSANKPSSFMISIYQKQAAQRRGFLANVKTVDRDEGYGIMYNVLAPEVYCPELIKVGTTEDGGKWMCAPSRLPDDCVIFALGINAAISYEKDLQEHSDHRCRVISVDSIEQPKEVIDEVAEIGGVVVHAKVGGQNNKENRTLGSILEKEGAHEVEIMKMDIEGAEFEAMGDFLEKYTPSQIMIEIHGTPKEAVEMLHLFSSKGYLLFHYEINGRRHHLCEYAFIHDSKLEHYGATYLARYL